MTATATETVTLEGTMLDEFTAEVTPPAGWLFEGIAPSIDGTNALVRLRPELVEGDDE